MTGYSPVTVIWPVCGGCAAGLRRRRILTDNPPAMR